MGSITLSTTPKTDHKQRIKQAEWQLAAGALWSNENDLVFTDEAGGHLKHHTVYNHFKRIAKSIGCGDARFHDLRYSYAINALQAGDSPKIVQEQLGHYSSAFTMDTYAEVSKAMRKESQERMEEYIKSVSNSWWNAVIITVWKLPKSKYAIFFRFL